jgi:hypothetical protein
MLIYCALFIWGGSPTAEAMDFDNFLSAFSVTKHSKTYLLLEGDKYEKV